MALEMVNRKIRFLWNAGGGTHVIVHNMTIESNTEQLLKNDQWFKIEVNRIGNIGTLSVKRTPDGQKPDPFEVSGASPVGYMKMDLDATSDFFIGGFPDDYLAPSELLSSSFSGCLYEALLDGKPVGLWNFISNKGCDGCKEGATEDTDISAFEFQGGNSYAIVPQIPYYSKSELYTVLSFKTLNEDALLFFSCNLQMGQFISIELKGGKVVYQLKLSEKSHIIIESSKKYNTGQWIRVEASRTKFEGQIYVEDEYKQETATKFGSSALDLRGMSLYYGGVPPNLTQERWPGVMFNNFFGCMRDLQIDSTPIDLSGGSFYGMTVGCSDRPKKVATFKGMGYLELNSQSLLSDSSISFSFLTHQRDALLLLSTYAGQKNANSEILQNYYSLALKDGRVVAMFNSGSGEILLMSDNTFSTGSFHTVNIIRKNRKLLLRVDDEEEAEYRLQKAAKDILTPKEGGLYFGGVKKEISVGSMAASQQPFVGIIQDAIFNDRLLRFDKAVSHKAVDFGFPDLLSISGEFFQQMAPSHPEERCTADLQIDEDAFSLKDEEYIEILLEKKDIMNDFNISFEYRTFYPEGNLISLLNEQKKFHLTTFLDKGLIRVDYARKKEHKNLRSNKELAIGKWHIVEITKHGKHLNIILDKHKSISLNVPKKLSFRKVHVGGLPQMLKNHSNKGTFKGCMRHLYVNGAQKRFPSESPCFKHIEFGTYFTGVGHLTQDHSFHLSEELDVSFQFRSTRVDGTLMYLHSRSAAVSFDLCLLDNMVLATMYGENSLKLQLSQSLHSNEGSCSYNWHDVNVSYKNNTFSLNVDHLKSVQQKVKQVDHLGFVEVYIGGKPEKHSYLGECKTNFAGCLRKLTLDGESLHVKNSENEPNVVQYSCPKL